MRVLLDVDGVLGDFLEASLNVINQINGFETPKEEVKSPFFVNLIEDKDHAHLTKKRQKYWEYVCQPGFCASIKPFPEAQEAVERLLGDARVDLYIVTSFLRTAPTWVYDRNAWLLEHFDISPRQVVHTKSKHTVSGDVFVDDTLVNVHGWREHNKGSAILWEQPYNRQSWEEYPSHGHNLVRTKSWDFVLGAVESLK